MEGAEFTADDARMVCTSIYVDVFVPGAVKSRKGGQIERL
jgi:hypothetical protein